MQVIGAGRRNTSSRLELGQRLDIRDALAPIIYSDVCPFRLELRRHGEEELQAPGQVLRSQLLLEQEEQEVCQVNGRRPSVGWRDLAVVPQRTCIFPVNKYIIIYV